MLRNESIKAQEQLRNWQTQKMHIWKKLAKCPLNNFLVVSILEKQILGFVAGYVFFKPIIPFGEICSHVKKNQGTIWKSRNIYC